MDRSDSKAAHGSRRRRWLFSVAAVTALVSLAACTESPSAQAIRAAQQYLRARAIQPGTENGLYRNVTWDAGDHVVGFLDDDRFPDWARGTFIACVRWEETFTKKSTDAETGEIRIQHGRAEGWILIGDGFYHHILELTVDFDGHHFDWIRAWEVDV